MPNKRKFKVDQLVRRTEGKLANLVAKVIDPTAFVRTHDVRYVQIEFIDDIGIIPRRTYLYPLCFLKKA